MDLMKIRTKQIIFEILFNKCSIYLVEAYKFKWAISKWNLIEIIKKKIFVLKVSYFYI